MILSEIIAEIEREAQKIIEDAEKKAQKIIEDAKKKASEILSDESYRIELEKWRKEYEEKTESELLWKKAQSKINDVAKILVAMVADIEIE
jgi:cell division septum initiation protein DivIVA